jgi:hypothetical protein
MFLLRAEDFSCILDVLYGGLGIRKLQFLIKKFQIFFKFVIIKIQIPEFDTDWRIGIQPKMVVPDPESINPGLKHRQLVGTVLY